MKFIGKLTQGIKKIDGEAIWGAVGTVATIAQLVGIVAAGKNAKYDRQNLKKELLDELMKKDPNKS